MNGEKHTEFLEMLRRCSNIMFRVCYMFTDRKPESIKDLYQDIVADAWVGYGSFRNMSAETTWIYRVALNRALQNIRHSERRPRLVELDDAIYASLSESARDPLVERLYELIDCLEPSDKALILLYLDNQGISRMAEINGCSKNTVKHRLTRIRNKLIEINENEQ
jgi:RNA polymerase sigma-70 factor (ECF subfamily)